MGQGWTGEGSCRTVQTARDSREGSGKCECLTHRGWEVRLGWGQGGADVLVSDSQAALCKKREHMQYVSLFSILLL